MNDNESMKSLILINNILKIYDECLDFDCVDKSRLNPKELKVSANRFIKIMLMLEESGYIKGTDYREFSDGSFDFDISKSSITLDGLKYYAENTNLLSKLGHVAELTATVIGSAAGIIN